MSEEKNQTGAIEMEWLELFEEPAYVVTTDTHEILYINEAARAFYGVGEIRTGVARTAEGAAEGAAEEHCAACGAGASVAHCYDTLRNSVKPCDGCHMCRLCPPQKHEWTYEHTQLGTLKLCTRMIPWAGQPAFLEVVRSEGGK